MTKVRRPEGGKSTPTPPDKKEPEKRFEEHVPAKDFRTGSSAGLKEHVWTVYQTKGIFSAIVALFTGIFGSPKPVMVEPAKKAEVKPTEIFQERIDQLVQRFNAVRDASIERDPVPLYNYLADISELEGKIQGHESNEKQLGALKDAANSVIDQRSAAKVVELELPVEELQQLAGKAKVNIPSNETFGETAKALRESLKGKIAEIEAGNDERERAFQAADEKLTAGKKQLEEGELDISNRKKEEEAEKEEELTKEAAQKKEDIQKRIGVEEEKIRSLSEEVKQIEELQLGFWRGRSLSREEEDQIADIRKQIKAVKIKIEDKKLELLKVGSQRDALKINAFEEIEKKYQAEQKALTEKIITPLESQRKIAEDAQNKASEEILGLRKHISELERIITRISQENKDKIEPIVRLQFYKEIFLQHKPERNVIAQAFIATHWNSTDKSPIYEYIRDVFGASSNILESKIDDISAQTILK